MVRCYSGRCESYPVYVCCCKQKTAYELRISDWRSDVCSSDRADIGIAHDERIVAEAGVLLRVGDDHRRPLADGVVAKGDVAGGFAGIQTGPRLEPLPSGVDQRDGGNRHAQNAADQIGDAVEGGFPWRV